MNVEELTATLGLDLDKESFLRAGEALEGLKIGLGGIAAFAAAAGAALLEMAHSTGEAAIAASSAAQRTGLSAAAFQELSYAAGMSGVSAETLEHSLILLSRTAYGAAEGSKELGHTYRQLGISVYDAHGKIKPADVLLEDLAEKFKTLPDGMRKTALVTQAFGRSGAQLLPWLNKGRDGIRELRGEAYDYGDVLREDVIKNSFRWEEQQKHLIASLTGLKFAIGGELLARMGDMTGMIAKWIAAHRELIATKLFAFLDGIKALLVPLVRAFDEIFIKTEAWRYSLYALAAVLAFMNLPLLGIIGALLIIEDIYKFFEGKPSVLGHIFGDGPEIQKIRAFMTEVKEFWNWLKSGGLGAELSRPNALGGVRDASPAEVAGALPAASFSPAQRDMGFWKGAAHRMFGAGSLEAGVSYVPSAPGPTGAGGSGSAPVINQTIVATPGMDVHDLGHAAGAAASDALTKHLREAQEVIKP